MSKDFERRLGKLEAAIGKPEDLETRIIIVSWVPADKAVLQDYPDCPGFETQIESQKNRQSGAIMVFCHADCSRKCREKEAGEKHSQYIEIMDYSKAVKPKGLYAEDIESSGGL